MLFGKKKRRKGNDPVDLPPQQAVTEPEKPTARRPEAPSARVASSADNSREEGKPTPREAREASGQGSPPGSSASGESPRSPQAASSPGSSDAAPTGASAQANPSPAEEPRKAPAEEASRPDGPAEASSGNPSPKENGGSASLPLDPAEAGRIYVLPNLMTAGNLFSGFMAILRSVEAKFAAAGAFPDPALAAELYTEAVWFILAALVFDILDGRLARLGGRESLFGKEFDSIADTVSFGVAPALLVFLLLLAPAPGSFSFATLGGPIGFIYLLCATVRLARFNVITHPAVLRPAELEKSDRFVGLPAPAAAGFIASLVLLLGEMGEFRALQYVLPPLLLLVAFLMVSRVPYPGFKHIDWKTHLRLRTALGVFIVAALLYQFRVFALCGLFLVYLFYGLWKAWQERRQAFTNS